MFVEMGVLKNMSIINKHISNFIVSEYSISIVFIDESIFHIEIDNDKLYLEHRCIIDHKYINDNIPYRYRDGKDPRLITDIVLGPSKDYLVIRFSNYKSTKQEFWIIRINYKNALELKVVHV